MAKGKREGKVTQKAMVETALQETGRGSKPLELQAYIVEKFGTELPTQVISTYKSQLKNAGGKRGAKRGRKGGPQFSDLEAVRGLVSRLGADQVKQLVDMAEVFA